MSQGGPIPGQGILNVSIKDTGALYNAYMPYVENGGLFVPTNKRYALGDEVFLLLYLVEEEERLPIPGVVVWSTPPGAQGNRTAGIGVQFNEGADGEKARSVIEAQLASMQNVERPTNTM